MRVWRHHRYICDQFWLQAASFPCMLVPKDRPCNHLTQSRNYLFLPRLPQHHLSRILHRINHHHHHFLSLQTLLIRFYQHLLQLNPHFYPQSHHIGKFLTHLGVAGDRDWHQWSPEASLRALSTLPRLLGQSIIHSSACLVISFVRRMLVHRRKSYLCHRTRWNWQFLDLLCS